MLNYVHTNAEQIILELKQAYENATGKALQNGDTESLLISVLAYREQQQRIGINLAANQNLLSFAQAPMIDYLGQLVGVTRLTPKPSVTTIEYSLSPLHTGVTIPAGIRIESQDGKVIYITDNEVTVGPGNTTASVTATASMAGLQGNGYVVGEINQILDPQAYLESAINTTITSAGNDIETDDELRERIRLAPNSFSTAGSSSSYEYWTRSISSDIGDIMITSTPNTGVVDIYLIMKDGSLPTPTLINQVETFLNSDKIRPLTDTVNVDAPTIINYDVEVEVTKVNGYVDIDIINKVNAAILAFKDSNKKIGKDVVLNQLIRAILQVEGVYDVVIIEPLSTVVVAEFEYAVMEQISVSITGSSNE